MTFSGKTRNKMKELNFLAGEFNNMLTKNIKTIECKEVIDASKK